MLLQKKGMLSKSVQDEDAQKTGRLASRRLSGRTWPDCQITNLAETIWPSSGPNPAVPNLACLLAGFLASLLAGLLAGWLAGLRFGVLAAWSAGLLTYWLAGGLAC
jgi:predicted lipid-binding transport protein (Tim44 family)